MTYRFPLKDVIIEESKEKRRVSEPLYEDGFYTVSQNEFSMDVPEVGWFYASGGNYISLVSYPGADINTIELYLNGSAYGAILHQRNILPLHGSSFVWNGKGILVCGDTGAGKSSLTASFCLNGAEFLTDDVTPIVFENNKPIILSLSDRIKLWEDSLSQLNQDKEGLKRIDPGMDKFYYPIETLSSEKAGLDHIVILEKSNKTEMKLEELSGTIKFASLRNEIYRWEYLAGMPETETYYFDKLIKISQFVNITKVDRPEKFNIDHLQLYISNYLSA